MFALYYLQSYPILCASPTESKKKYGDKNLSITSIFNRIQKINCCNSKLTKKRFTLKFKNVGDKKYNEKTSEQGDTDVAKGVQWFAEYTLTTVE